MKCNVEKCPGQAVEGDVLCQGHGAQRFLWESMQAEILNQSKLIAEGKGPLSVKQLVAQSHGNSQAHGFWNQQSQLGDVSFVPEKLALIHSEISEALEAYRDFGGVAPTEADLSRFMYEHSPTCGNVGSCCEPGKPRNPKPIGFASELADVMIRIADLCGRLGIDLERAVVEKHEYNVSRPFKHGKVC